MEETAGGFSLTVIVPVRNGSGTLHRVLARIRDGLIPGDSLIVSDDGSTDDSVEIASAYSAEVVSPVVGGGAAAARNAGAAAAKGEWLLFVDSDAVPPTGWRGMLASRVASGADAVQAIYSREAVSTSPATFYKNYYYHYTFTRRIKGEHINGCGTFFFSVRRTAFLEMGGFDEMVSGASIEDADFAERFVAAGKRIVLAPEVEVLHLRRYTFSDLMKYDWNMIRAKALYMLRRDRSLGRPSVSMASPGEMLPVIVGAMGVWGIVLGASLGIAGLELGWAVSALCFFAVVVTHLGFWRASMKQGGLTGLAAGMLVFPDLILIVPGFLSAVFSVLRGKRY